jgi:hypothetical protein
MAFRTRIAIMKLLGHPLRVLIYARYSTEEQDASSIQDQLRDHDPKRRPLMDFRTVTTEERQKLIDALRGNAEDNLSILMDRRDTSFVGTSEEVSDDEVISAIQSVPCHY